MKPLLLIAAITLIVIVTCLISTRSIEKRDAADAACAAASEKATYSEDLAEMREGMAYFREHCTWDGSWPVAK